MTIKEIEELTGMTRANIRFYEAQGLINPARGENGYRDYSEDDLSELLRIKLLRALQLPLEDIRAVKTGEAELGMALDKHLVHLEQEALHLENAQEICMRLRKDGAQYETLDAESYLNVLELSQTEGDTLPKVRAPIRRLFARSLDFAIYGLVWNLCLWLFSTVDLLEQDAGWEFAGTFVCIIMMVLIEPLLLHFFGTTPGKAILGLYVTDIDGFRLSYTAALERTVNVLVYGEGLRIPFLALWRNWRSYTKCENGEELEWEEHSVLSLRDEKGVRALWFILAETLLIALNFCLVYTQFIPRNTGELTVAEFAENFNYVAERQDYAPDMRLDPDGSWIEYGGTIIHIFGTDYESPEFQYETDEKGHITAIRMEKYYTDLGGYPPNIDSEMALAIQAFVRPRLGFINPNDETDAVIELLNRSTWNSWGAQCNGVNITHRTELEGYQYIVSLLKPIEGEEQRCRLFFEMKVMN